MQFRETMLFRLDNVQKHYGHYEALKGICLQIDSMSVGLLGPNGAGKSTFIKSLLGLLPITAGAIEVLKYRVPDQAQQVRQRIGYMPENDSFLPYMTALQYVSFGGRLAGMPKAAAFRRAHEVLYYVGLGEARYRKLDGFSTGMKQRVKLAQAIVHGPKLIFLDEPTNGLDPTGRDEILRLVKDIRDQGVHIVLSSHILHDVEQVCDDIIMLNHGELLYAGPLATMTSDTQQSLIVSTKNNNAAFIALLRENKFDAAKDGARIKIQLTSSQKSHDILALAKNHQIQIRHFVPGELTLETAFLELLNQPETPDHQAV